MRRIFGIGLVIGCVAGALVAPLLAQSWNRLYATRIAVSLTAVTITRATTVATATKVAHGLLTGDRVTVSGADQAEYNGAVLITRTGADTFTYTVAGAPATPATGSIAAAYAGGDSVPLATNASGQVYVAF